MTFPVSVVHVEDRIYLQLGYISNEFKAVLRTIRSENGTQIRSDAEPQFQNGVIYINGSNPQSNYRNVSIPYTDERYRSYVNAIKFYKKALGYDE